MIEEDKIKVYIAAPWVRKAEALETQEKCEAAGLEVTSCWIKYHPEVLIGSNTPEELSMLSEQAEADLADLEDADAVIYLNLQKSEGKATELGYAVALNKFIILVGDRKNNIFLHLPEVIKVDTIEEAITFLQRYFIAGPR